MDSLVTCSDLLSHDVEIFISHMIMQYENLT
jgi:hypothetical protein